VTTAFYVIMELGSGDLVDVTRTLVQNKEQAYGTALQMLYGAFCCHEAGYIHKDIKPLNYLMAKNGRFIWTNDFGLAQKLDSPQLGLRWGTPYYMPTESASRSKTKYDVFAIGRSFQDLSLGTYLGPALVNSMVAPRWPDRPDVGTLIDTVAKMATLEIRRSVQGIKNSLAAAKKNLVAAKAKYETVSTRRRTADAHMEHVAQIPIDSRSKMVRRVTGDKEGHLSVRKHAMAMRDAAEASATAARLEKEAEDSTRAVNEQLHSLTVQLATVEADLLTLHQRLAMDRTPDVIIDQLMKGHPLTL